MPPTPRRLAVAFSVLTLIWGARPAPAQNAVQLPEGVKAVWDQSRAWRETTPTRERISLNGLWRWQPAPKPALPAGGWGYLRVPEPWPAGNPRSTSSPTGRLFYPHPDWAKTSLRSVTAAW